MPESAWVQWCALTDDQREMCLRRAGMYPPEHPARRPLRHPIWWWRGRRRRTSFIKKLDMPTLRPQDVSDDHE